MAGMIDIDFNPDERMLRQFGWVSLFGFGALAALAWTEKLVFAFGLGEAREPVALGLLAVGVLAAFLGLVAPRMNRFLFVGLMILAFPIGFVVSYVLLGFIFFGILTPVALGLRVVGHDPLQRKIDPAAESYWEPAAPAPPRKRYFRQY